MSQTPSYIDYETLLSAHFSAHALANSLVLSTNNPADSNIDLSTPLSRTLFDLQEIDTHIHNLTARSAVPILEHVKDRDDCSRRILDRVGGEVDALKTSYERLQREVLVRYEEAERARVGSLRSLEVLRLGRLVSRAVGLARQLEIQGQEAGLIGRVGKPAREDHMVMVRAVYTILEFRGLLEGGEGGKVEGEEGRQLQRVNIVKTTRQDLVQPLGEKIKSRAQQIIREFSISNLASSTAAKTASAYPASTATTTTTTLSQPEEAKSRTTSAIVILYLLSPPPPASPASVDPSSLFTPTLLLSSLQTFLQNSLTSSLASISRALTTLPTLERTLVEVSARCQNVTALEMLLAEIPPPKHPLVLSPESPTDNEAPSSLLTPLLDSLDTTSLPSYFWRSLASTLSNRVQEILNRGGVSARTLKSNRDRVGAAIRECVLKAGEVPGGGAGYEGGVGKVSWEREAAVMAGSVVGVLAR